MKNIIFDYIQKEMDALGSLDYSMIDKIYASIMNAYRTGGRIYLIGNGGSAANAAHWVNDIKKNTSNINNGFDVTSLCDNVSLLTAFANDVAYADVFLEQLKGSLRKKDVLIALSVSGSSSNIVRAMQYAREIEAKTISIVADYNGILEAYSDVVLKIYTKSYGIAEDIQQSINHILVQKIKEEFNTNLGEELIG